ncbi:hypothetical protein DFH08DRAFT_1072922 [Mycena albidolilacea]|uniref:Uncharacterized protein n=1 Tax=Mycena albidolilacea TaxID=1033008 RepID=A0AAD7ANS9_9AGAR|nr:hypothetical protein DFH08DRAFT_1072922 [Mycena albidolilacea]
MPVPSNDPLAAQLNDLALANSDGLLSDDEYRLLRQNLFERYSGGVEILSLRSSTTTTGKYGTAPRRKHVEVVEQPIQRAAPSVTPSRSKISGVAGLLRRATGRSKSASPAPTPIKLSLIPRMFSKKPDDALSSDTDSSSGTRHSTSRSFSRSGSTRDLDLPPARSNLTSPVASPTRPKANPTPPSSPFRANFDVAPRSPSRSTFATNTIATNTTPSRYDVIPGGSNDIFDDDNLSTAEAIRKAILAVEAEGRRLVSAFNDLETSAVIRYRREHPPRQRSGPAPSPLPRRTLSPAPTSGGAGNSGHTPNRSRSNSYLTDTQSIRSNSSLRTAKSIGSLLHSTTPPPPASALSQSTSPAAASPSAWMARLPSLRRKGSASSLSSQGASPPGSSFLTAPRAVSPSSGLSRSISLSRSTGHLPLAVPMQRHGSGGTMMELLSAAQPPAGEGGEELAEVRRRRAEMVGRCEARLEYLRAKLKAQEIHERLMRK